MSSYVSLLSGGLDSTVATFMAAQLGGVGICLVFDYGQRAVKREIDATKKIAKQLGSELRVIRLPFLEEVTSTALVMNDKVIPQVKMSKLDDRTEAEKSAMQVWVPNRNGLFLNIAAAIAEGEGFSEIIVGFNAEEAATFPDNSANFVDRMDRCFELSTLTRIQVKAPTIGMTKTEIVKAGLKVRAPFDLVWSCYRDRKKMCGRCESCVRSIRAYQNNNLWPQMQKRFEALT